MAGLLRLQFIHGNVTYLHCNKETIIKTEILQNNKKTARALALQSRVQSGRLLWPGEAKQMRRNGMMSHIDFISPPVCSIAKHFFPERISIAVWPLGRLCANNTS